MNFLVTKTWDNFFSIQVHRIPIRAGDWPALFKKHTMSVSKKYFSFLFPVPVEFMPSVKVITQYEINVRYSLHWNKKVELEAYTLKTGMAKHITDFQKLEDQMLAAAENNSKQYRAPGQGGHKSILQPGEDPYQDAILSLKEKEYYGY